MKPTRALALKHAETDLPGTLPELFAEQGIDLEVTHIGRGLVAPEKLDLLVVMGCPESAYDHRVPWLFAELEWLKAVQARGVPTLGICFGSQILARALGGECYRNREVETAWTELQTPEADWQHKGPWLSFHFDAFRVPPGATLLGYTDKAPQAYRLGCAMGVQFHPEITPEMFDTWTAHWRTTEEGRRFLAESGDLPERIRAEIVAREADNRANCRALLADFLARC